MNPSETPVAATSPRRAQRKKALLAVTLGVLLVGAAYGAYGLLFGGQYETTDNAYVQGNVVQITPQVSGTVLSIAADDTDYVRAGQTLVTLDASDARVALEQAEAQLAQTVREVRVLFANNGALQSQVSLREADLARARSELARAQDDVTRRTPLVATGAVGKEEFNHANAQLNAARSAVAAAESAVAAARQQLTSNQSLTDGTSVDAHPNVQRAAARVREAYLALRRTELAAPVEGHVARRSVQIGQRVQAGAPLMSVVPLKQVWVDANFKESQLQRLRIGQPVTLIADVYGSKVEYHGKVEGLGAGTGAAFSLLPAQNATGNWIKVVQRVPVRVALDARELEAHPLRVGLSMEARVDVADQGGKTLADAPRRQPTAQASGGDGLDRGAEAAVRKIIAANLGTPGRSARHAATVAAPAADTSSAHAARSAQTSSAHL
ncbi:HlyD family efflux transporter periplasmic adaptor subunit [Caldimonas brevitalea]|uniref:Hemolysin D n=1 Tax=Caldimonas brevitalea TaxID=413882 RepID=A0A0G3BKL5_9BURK|nr:HlyD family efflux transporter periplasmic adaptor subunit [Caldimonas brevitalea]AKJ30004.1 hemolysin D [Caldimonas brevitalea]